MTSVGPSNGQRYRITVALALFLLTLAVAPADTPSPAIKIDRIVILKSARKRQLDEPASAQKVHLVRHAERFDNGSCGVVADFGEKEVPSESYDRYHDEGRKVRERQILHAFHFRYAARKGTCRQTDDGTQDFARAMGSAKQPGPVLIRPRRGFRRHL